MAAPAPVHARESENDRDFIDLPSGGTIDIFNFDLVGPSLKTQEDAHLVMQVMTERMINIEYQLDAFGLGFWPDGRKITRDEHPHPLWQARAKKALGYARLIKSTAQQRIQAIAGNEMRVVRQDRAARTAQIFLDIAKGMLDKETYTRIFTIAQAIEGHEYGQEKGGGT